MAVPRIERRNNSSTNLSANSPLVLGAAPDGSLSVETHRPAPSFLLYRIPRFAVEEFVGAGGVGVDNA